MLQTLAELEAKVVRHNLSLFVEAGEALAETRASRFAEMSGTENSAKAALNVSNR